MSSYSIKDLEKLSGIKAHTLRIWEKRYKLLRPGRSETNIRSYDDHDLKKILNVSLLNSRGLKISSIAGFNEAELLKHVNRILDEDRSEAVQIDALTLSLIEMNELRFGQIIDNCINLSGFDNTFEKVVFPFLRQLGNMWQVGLISAAQEHYISNLVRQKLLAGIDRIKPVNDSTKKTFVFFLPENELHELGLMYLHYLSRVAGHRCYYLGQSVPTEDLLTVAALFKPHYLVTVITSPLDGEELNAMLTRIRQGFPEAKLLLSGRYLFERNHAGQFTQSEQVFTDYSAFKNFI